MTSTPTTQTPGEENNVQKLRERIHALETELGEMHAILQDLGGIEKIREEMLGSKKFAQAVEASTDAVSMLLPTLEYIYVNPAWQKMTGYTKEETLGKTPDELQSGKGDLKFFVDLHTAAEEGKIFQTEMKLQRKNGKEYDAELTMYPIKEHGEPVLYVIFHSDITQRKKLEAAQSEFVSLSSHQLRTPLTAIRWIFNTLEGKKQGPLTDMQMELIHDGQKCVLHMAETIGILLTISRIEAGKVQLEYTDVNLQSFLQEIADEQKVSYAEKQQDFSLVCSLGLSLRTDPRLLKEVISNLLSNAIKYTPVKGSVTIRAEKTDQDRVRIDVTDTGCGIPSYQQERVFSKFFRAENALQEHTDGTGLGLYMGSALVTMMRGTMSFTSEENKGTTFTVHFPAVPHAEADPDHR
jgi:PAS domain S-box-containing protein